ncbi:endopeptidase La [Acidiferrimicrobium sp. IK]|uniref:endopeptidase La n=1 Tax=Acidiferrimicrobium sp. IK TaxID=2871700 RepID=UPI0021CB50CE|nr:endopeptidase La [Acidiferrimicrobium sp. IK]MCU4184389.1 endopeptidase La [Acidiferrimicrobium sp. IK]
MASLTTSAFPLLPLDAGVVLPGMTITLALETPEARAAVDAAAGAGDQLLLVPRLGRGEGPDATGGHYARIGTVASIARRGALPGGTPAVVVTGGYRATVGAATAAAGPALWVNVERVEEPEASEDTRAAARELRAVLEAIAEHRGVRLTDVLRGASEPGALADLAGYWPELSVERKVELLESTDPAARVTLVLGWAREALAELELKDRIRTDVAEGMERTQREYLLRQQLAAIRKELGQDGDEEGGDDYRSRLEALSVSDAVRSAISREIDKLERTGEQSPEQGWIRTWLDTILDLPWGKRSDDLLDVAGARAVLDADHTGLDEVKERIVEHLAVRKLRAERGLDDDGAASVGGRRAGGMILALVGPPGVGKTSLGESVARSMNRSFVRVALGGVRDEAEIRGHRRTYVGALPGRIVRAIKEAGTMNPVILLDEVDKLGSDYRGDPSAALLEVLDPAQNHTFRDHYLDVDLDLSDVLFLATANVVYQIPLPLLDRMEVVRLDGYTEDEKVAIGRDHLLGRQLAAAGLLDGEVVVTDAALRLVVSGYTREAGVRSLERQLGRLLRKAAARIVSEPDAAPLRIDEADVGAWLGRRRFVPEAAERTSVPGVATGLAVTGIGGDVLFVEASASSGDAGLTVTGQLGDVMQESAQIALSYVRSHAGDVGVGDGAFEKRRLHLHVPAGAVPKDGPSAGVTMTTALVSLLSGRPVRSEVGMTGEITLQGKVLPIGGVKQKVLAAHQAGLTEVILPARNEPDLEDVPEAVRAVMTFHLASDIGQVLEHALVA